MPEQIKARESEAQSTGDRAKNALRVAEQQVAELTNALEARAKRLADPAWRPSPAEAAAIERERREMENWTYRGTEALVMATPEDS